MSGKVKIEVVGLTAGQNHNGSYTLIMGEPGSRLKLPIVIGNYEAQTIAFEMEGLKPTRPMTHDLFKSFATAFNIRLEEVYINDLIEGIFYSQLIFEMNGSAIYIDARTSDAISIALRFKSPIYIKKSILDNAGILLDDEELDAPARSNEDIVPMGATPFKDNYKNLSVVELENLLKEALEEEDYDKAAIIRDEITLRNMS